MNPLEQGKKEKQPSLAENDKADDAQSTSSEHKTLSDIPDDRLTIIEGRILGALMEKQLSTPDSYPLTVNSLLSACNQKSSREPVSRYEQGEIVRTLRVLEQKRFVQYEMGSRSERYHQRLTTELSLSKKQQALLCVMMLRGPQTPAELFSRTQRLFSFTDRDDMQLSLDRLTQGDEPTAVLIPRKTGQRDDRYGHLLCGIPAPVDTGSSAMRTDNDPPAHEELKVLKEEIRVLRKQLNTLYEMTGHSIDD